MTMTRSTGDNTMAHTVFVGGTMLVALAAGVLVGLPWQAILPVGAAAAVAGLLIAAMASSAERLSTWRWQEAAVAVAAWAGHNGGRCETSPDAFDDAGTAGEWTLPDSPHFSGTILAVARRHGREVGIACHEQPYGEGATSRHTTFLVRLAQTHQHARLTTRRSAAGMAEAVAAKLAALPARPELAEIQDRELRVVYFGWPGSMDLDAHLDAGVEVARVLDREEV